MKKYELNPKEELKLEFKPNRFDQERKNNRILLMGILAGAVICWFLWYVMAAIPNFYPLLLIMAIICGIAVLAYATRLATGILGKTEEKYYITNVRVIVANNDEEVLKEVYISQINKVVADKVTGSSYDMIINPKEETDHRKLRKHKSDKPLYTAETVILRAVNAAKIRPLIEK